MKIRSSSSLLGRELIDLAYSILYFQISFFTISKVILDNFERELMQILSAILLVSVITSFSISHRNTVRIGTTSKQKTICAIEIQSEILINFNTILRKF